MMSSAGVVDYPQMWPFCVYNEIQQPRHRSGRGCRGSVIKGPQKMIHLFIPPGPVMVDIMAPVVDPGRDGFFPEQKIQVTGIFNGLILPGALPHTHNNLTAPVPIQIPRIVQAGPNFNCRRQICPASISTRP